MEHVSPARRERWTLSTCGFPHAMSIQINVSKGELGREGKGEGREVRQVRKDWKRVSGAPQRLAGSWAESQILHSDCSACPVQQKFEAVVFRFSVESVSSVRVMICTVLGHSWGLLSSMKLQRNAFSPTARANQAMGLRYRTSSLGMLLIEERAIHDQLPFRGLACGLRQPR